MKRSKGPILTIARAKQRYRHGTRARYALAKCRCHKCTKANRQAVAEQTLRRTPYRKRKGTDGVWRVYHVASNRVVRRVGLRDDARALCDQMNAEHRARHPDPTQLMATDAVVRHVRRLQAEGVGLKQIARSAGISYSPLSRIMERDIVRTRYATAQKILAVTVDAIAGGARVRGDETLVLIERLVAAGISRRAIARELGNRGGALQIGKHTPWITVRTARAIHALYCELQSTMDALPQIDRTFRVGVTESTATRTGRRSRTATRKAIFSVQPDASRYGHGTRARYTEHGCRCRSCAKANATYEASLITKQPLRFVLRAQGALYTVLDASSRAVVFKGPSRRKALAVRDAMNIADPVREGRVLIDPDAVTAHIRQLLAAGASTADIARAAGCTQAHIMRLRDRIRSVRGVSRSIARRILAVDATCASGVLIIDAAPSWRLLDRLTAVGFRKEWVAKTAGITISYRGAKIRADRAQAIAAVYGILRERVTLIQELEAREKAGLSC